MFGIRVQRGGSFLQLFLVIGSLLFSAGLTALHAQENQYPLTISIPVTFYDFHSDQSNPEFEINAPGTVARTGMVAPTLDVTNKPQLGPEPYFNQRIDRWFRPWVPGDSEIYNYIGEPEAPRNRFSIYEDYPEGLTTLPFDTSFKNIGFLDTLLFQYVAGSAGLYEFTSNSFFPLDGKGFGDEGNEHNYSFTMELHWQFTMVPGLTFNFTGDDDVWAFVDKKLAMDIGGIHTSLSGAFNVDDIPGLEANKKYYFDFFYAERHVRGSTIRITTNIISPPATLLLYGKPGAPGVDNPPITELDTIRPGDTVTVYGHIFDSLGVARPEFDSLITWTIEPAGILSLSAATGSVTTLSASEIVPGSEIVLIASFKNPYDQTQPTSEVRIRIGVSPGEDHIDIVPDSVAGRAQEVPFSSFAFEPGVATPLPLYAVVRDKSGRFIRFANSSAQWVSGNSSVVTLDPATGSSTVVFKQITSVNGNTVVIATEGVLRPDTLNITSFTNEDHLDIVRDSAAGRAKEVAATEFAFDPGSTILPLYAVVRDASGNFVRFVGASAQWISSSGQVATVAPPTGSSVVVTRVISRADGAAMIIVSEGVIKSDTLTVSFITNEDHLDIVRTRAAGAALETSFPSYTFGPENKMAPFFAVVRDASGNFVRFADVTASWSTGDKKVASVIPVNGDSTMVHRELTGIGEKTIVVITEGTTLRPDTLIVVSKGIESEVVAPNPFEPMSGNINAILPPATREIYKNVLQSVTTNAITMVAVQTPEPLVVYNNGTGGMEGPKSYAQVLVYDALGNIVRRDLPLIRANNALTYGVVWDGTNDRNRYVGGGGYLFILSGKLVSGKAYISKQKVGVLPVK